MERAREYHELIARAFNGAIVVDGMRIVGHASGLLWLRTPNQPRPTITARPLDPENDWSEI